MTERGTFEVPFYYESLSKNSNEIKNSIIKVDKMLYLYQPDVMSIRYDMGILKNLLAKSSFFDPGRRRLHKLSGKTFRKNNDLRGHLQPVVRRIRKR